MMQPLLKQQAPAKVNLSLAVHGQRPDGYHDISTIFLKISLADTLYFEETQGGIVVHCNHPQVPSDHRNLVYQAAMALQPWARGRGVRLRLHKAIPVAGGLGGGSSDAAATLLGLNALWGLRLSPGELGRIAAGLGADVPFFLLPSVAALGRGRGDELEPLTCPGDLFLVLVNPRVSVSTAQVYSQVRFELTGRTNDTNIPRGYLETGNIAGLGATCFNELEAVVSQQFPVVQRVKRALTRPGVEGVCMSGSGPTVFALCASAEVAQEVAAAVQGEAWDIWVCRPWQSNFGHLV